MSQLPTIKQLRYFKSLVKYQHFGRAAEASHVSQSAFSVAIKELENLVGLQLVDRTNKQVTVTETGHEFAAGARQILEDLETLVSRTRGHLEPLCGKLTLGIIPTIAPFLLPKVLTNIKNDYPSLELFLVEDLSQRLYERLMLGEIDLILLALPYPLRGVDMQTLFEDRFYLAHHQTSKWLSGTKQQDVDSEAVLLLEDGHCLRDHAISACKIKQKEKVSRFAASSIFTLIQMINEDLGVTYLPEMALESSLLAETDIETSAMPADSFREIGLAWRQGSSRTQEFLLLGEYINHSRS